MRKIVVKIFGKYSDAYYLYTIIKNKNKIKITTMEAIKKVNKQDFQVHQFIGGYYGICETSGGGCGCVFGGDSANEDDYCGDYIAEVYDQWDGTLTYTDRYGYRIEL